MRTSPILDDIKDVRVTNPIVGHTLTFDGTHWNNADPVVDRIQDGTSVLAVSDGGLVSLTSTGAPVLDIAPGDTTLYGPSVIAPWSAVIDDAWNIENAKLSVTDDTAVLFHAGTTSQQGTYTTTWSPSGVSSCTEWTTYTSDSAFAGNFIIPVHGGSSLTDTYAITGNGNGETYPNVMFAYSSVGAPFTSYRFTNTITGTYSITDIPVAYSTDTTTIVYLTINDANNDIIPVGHYAAAAVGIDPQTHTISWSNIIAVDAYGYITNVNAQGTVVLCGNPNTGDTNTTYTSISIATLSSSGSVTEICDIRPDINVDDEIYASCGIVTNGVIVVGGIRWTTAGGMNEDMTVAIDASTHAALWAHSTYDGMSSNVVSVSPHPTDPTKIITLVVHVDTPSSHMILNTIHLATGVIESSVRVSLLLPGGGSASYNVRDAVMTTANGQVYVLATTYNNDTDMVHVFTFANATPQYIGEYVTLEAWASPYTVIPTATSPYSAEYSSVAWNEPTASDTVIVTANTTCTTITSAPANKHTLHVSGDLDLTGGIILSGTPGNAGDVITHTPYGARWTAPSPSFWKVIGEGDAALTHPEWVGFEYDSNIGNDMYHIPFDPYTPSNYTRNDNIAMGKGALHSLNDNVNGTGNITAGNIGMGAHALNHLRGGEWSGNSDNISIGRRSLATLTDGSYNIAIGEYAGSGLDTGDGNVYIGRFAGTGAGNTNDNIFLSTGSGMLKLRHDGNMWISYDPVSVTGLTLSGATSPISLDGNTGLAGQVLTSAGATNTPVWAGGAYVTTMGNVSGSVFVASLYQHAVVTGNVTWNLPTYYTTGAATEVVLELLGAGSYTNTWGASIDWNNGTPPVLTPGGVDIIKFYTRDGGITWRGFQLGKDMR